MTSVFDQGPFPACPEPFNMAAYVLGAGALAPDRIALSVVSLDGAEHWTYGRLIRAIRGTALGFCKVVRAPGIAF